MVQGCCQSLVNVSFSKSLASQTEAVEHVVNGTADLVAPLIVKTGKTKLLSFPFISYGELRKISVNFKSFFFRLAH